MKMLDSHSDVVLCMSFNTDGSLLATSCKDKHLRIIEPRSGKVLQVGLSVLDKHTHTHRLSQMCMCKMYGVMSCQ